MGCTLRVHIIMHCVCTHNCMRACLSACVCMHLYICMCDESYVQWNPALRTPLKSEHLDYADTF